MNVAVLQDCSLAKPGENFDLKPETAVRETQNGELWCWGRKPGLWLDVHAYVPNLGLSGSFIRSGSNRGRWDTGGII
jgi:hypothetical protein